MITNREKLNLLLILLEELVIDYRVRFDMSRKAGGTQGHKWGSKLKQAQQFKQEVKKMLTESWIQL